MNFIAQQLAVLAVACAGIAGAGTLIAPRSGAALRCAVGIGAWMHALFFLALIGQLRAIPIGVLAVIAVAGLLRGPHLPRRVPVVFAALFIGMFVVALRPPLAFDETLYHLPFVRALARSGALQFRAGLRYPVFPQMHELLCVPLLLAGGDVATHLPALIEVAITTALLLGWANSVQPVSGVLAAALFAGSPIVVHLGTINYVEAGLMLFVTAGFYCLDQRRFALSGFFLGTACCVKYLGGYFAVAALAWIVIVHRDRVLGFIASCAAAALPTTLWITIHTGDPVFPFARPGLWTLPPLTASFGEHLRRIVRVVWDVTFARERINHQPPFSPLFIVMLAVVILAARRDRRALAVAVIVGVYVVIFSFLPQDSRYLVALLPLVSLVSGAAIARVFPRAAAWMSVVAAASGLAYIVYSLAVRGLPPVNPATRETFLASHVPAYTALMHAGADRVYNCGGEQLKSYARGEYLGDFSGPFSFDRVLGSATSTSAIATSLRRVDARYFLVANPACAPRRVNGGMELVYADQAAQLWRVDQASNVR